MSPSLRKKIIGGLLLLTLVATVYIYLNEQSGDSSEISLPVAEQKVMNTLPQPAQVPEKHDIANTRFLQDASGDIFQPKVKIVEAPPPAQVLVATPVLLKPLPPRIPVAPPLPFIYVGKYIEDGELVVFLGYRGKDLMVKIGDVIQQTYKVEDIKPPLLTMTYMPMDVKQSMQIGEMK